MNESIKDLIMNQQGSSYALHPDLVEFIIDALNKNDISRVSDLSSQMHSADIAEFLNIIAPEQRQQFISIIRDNFDPEILVDLEPEIKDEVIALLGAKESAAAITKLDSDDAVQIIEDMEKEEQQEILAAIPKEQRDILKEGLSYTEETAGRLMNTKFVAVPEDWDVGKTIDYLRSTDTLPDDFYEIFVVDNENHPVGGVLTSRVIRKNRNVFVKDIMESDLKTINLVTDQEEVAYIFRKYALASAPVINADGKLVGVISVDDVVNIIEEEAEEDIMLLGGVRGATDLYMPSMQTAIRRAPWLFINLLTAIVTSSVIASFDQAIEKLLTLAVLMPVTASLAGNAGTQTMTIAVRAIATKELTITNAMRVLRKEILSSLLNGILFSIIVGLTSFVIFNNLQLSMIFSTAILIVLIIAAFAGTTIPLFLSYRGVDPAVASGIFLTAVTDISSFSIFLGLAAYFLV